jgi:hypothetical protein
MKGAVMMVGPASKRVEFFKHLHAPALAGEADTGGQATEATAYDDGSRRSIGA